MDKAIARRIRDFLRQRLASLDHPRRLGKPLTGTLGDLWSYRVGDYRILCRIEDEILVVLVVGIGHRWDVYR
jgi:mRNA interferase RelE/StbE